jgi:large subunit ribosomal protein L24
MRIRKGDKVIVRSGKYRGQRCEVVRTIPSDDKLVLEGVNIAKRHTKPTRSTNQGGIIDKFMPMPAASVSLWCSSHDGPARAGIKSESDGTKIRICRQCGAEL